MEGKGPLLFTMRKYFTCGGCNYSWFSRVESPKRCANPFCKRRDYTSARPRGVPRSGRPSAFPVYSLRPGESVFLPFTNDARENSARLDKIRRYSKRTGKEFERIARPGGLQVTRLYEPGSI